MEAILEKVKTKVNRRKVLLVLIDALIVNLALFLGLVFRFDGQIPTRYLIIFTNSVVPLTVINILVYYRFRLYSSLWKYASIDELIQVFCATVLGSLISFTFGAVFNMMQPRSVYMITWMICFLFIGGSRLTYRIMRRMMFIHTHPEGKNVMIIGAGASGSVVIRELRRTTRMLPVVVIDDDVSKQGLHIHGVEVKGGKEDIIEMAELYHIDEIIIAMPSASKKTIKEILDVCTKTNCRLKTLPSIQDFNGEVDLNKVRDVNIEDLLGREEIKVDIGEISDYLTGEVVLVTGGGGSIGSELCRQIAKFNPKKLLLLDIYENNAYDLQNELKYEYKEALDLEVLIASVRDRSRLEQIFATYSPSVVFHAAAHKHVPLMEANPSEAIKNNVMGTLNVAECADIYGAKRFVLISTDKAVNPTNIMGATKRVAEMIIQHMSNRSTTEFVAVRFGNVLGSNGSVIPLFKRQIEQGGPITVTHPDITRFFMTIREATELVLQAGAMAEGGEIFVLDMGQPVKIAKLAEDLIKLSGLVPHEDVKIEFTGLRPGEKLYEELLMAEEGIINTKHEKIFIGKPIDMNYNQFMEELEQIKEILNIDNEGISEFMCRIVPTYSRVG